MTTEIYLDGNATTAVLPAAIAAAADAMGQRYGNPSSSHGTGLKAKVLLDQTRACAVRLLGVGDGRLMFNSGATEGIQTAVLSALVALRERRERGEAIGSLLVYGATEHKAVPESLAHWNRLLGLNLTLQKLPVDQDGAHDLALLRQWAPQAALVCTMAANNETGIITDLAAIEVLLAETGSAAYWLVDCVQALGKLDLDLASTRIDYAPFSGHKLYAPKGIGMLYVRAGAPFTPLIMGGGQEGGQRSGTENMAGIAALGAVLSALERGDTFRSHHQLASFRARLADSLRAALPGVVFNHPFDKSLPTTLNFSVPGLSSRELMDVFDAAQVRVSSGSACSAAKAAPSYVLDAMQAPLWRSAGAIRMSFGPLADEATIEGACRRIERCGAALRASCLIPSERTAVPHDGLLQLGVEGACSWMVLDAASRSCIVIDPLPDMTARIESYVRCQNYQVQAIVSTSPGIDRSMLISALGRHVDSHAATDAYGWPASGDAIELGNQTLLSVADGAARHYLLGNAVDAALPPQAVRFAFSARPAVEALRALTCAQTLLCPTRDEHNQFCVGMAAPAASAMQAALQLDRAAFEAFLQAHPDTELIDVREPYEFAATTTPGTAGRGARSVPLSRLAEHASGWLQGDQTPLVFFCRSGNRSLKAAQLLQRLGHAQAYSLSGGLALAPLAHAA
ncbi:aminotransferase class V-fold PLP-dependent enzyme [Duganella violaceipulchra]|uniref:Aminotransferase class V-fold PLP-dependent enzyme n=1 Tax=Duganella violaceipulchra TaxID=2849652 RepID=A0AA41H6G2_9BURK|nr:aminotransferase class V-fold PLP-dependent enzyme [Duganella violaceicalia]MBV6322818.1 aminotransferase class V-fold PLP-dependent enzyme [Duganella violaceicalia]MCP2007898.1 cysteine sulfinate desulfinase/cysteine desulfurase-like protein/rhodanese-related sulfurtransferase [Duganella violaceicalia]